jgi:guanylate kinase
MTSDTDPTHLYVISAPSGAGKTSLVRALLQARPRLVVSVSHTTRARREGEVEGESYFFVTVERFEALIKEGAFLEYARVFDNYYGTGRAQVEQRLHQGRDVVLEIDWQGAQQVRRAQPACISIFILPPSRQVLEQRLYNRGTDSEAVIQRRLADAATDMSHCPDFDYAIINDSFDQALSELGSILDGRGESLRSSRAALQPFLAELVA